MFVLAADGQARDIPDVKPDDTTRDESQFQQLLMRQSLGLCDGFRWCDEELERAAPIHNDFQLNIRCFGSRLELDYSHGDAVHSISTKAALFCRYFAACLVSDCDDQFGVVVESRVVQPKEWKAGIDPTPSAPVVKSFADTRSTVCLRCRLDA